MLESCRNSLRLVPISAVANKLVLIVVIIEASPMAAQMFGNAGIEHMKKYGTKPEHFAKIAWKNHKHSVNNPNSQFRDEYTLEQIQKSPKVHGPLTKLQVGNCFRFFFDKFNKRDNIVVLPY